MTYKGELGLKVYVEVWIHDISKEQLLTSQS
jgi:hypothetical protein